jgi:hypothetical protein
MLGLDKKKDDRYAALDRDIQADHSRFVQSHQQLQQVISL